MTTLHELARSIASSSLHTHVVDWLRTVPGLPPIVQAVHILSIACVIASIVFIDLRVLGIAARRQSVVEMNRRLMPWLWTALVFLFLSGAMFVIARPARYFSNPIFGIKMALLLPALLLAVWSQRQLRHDQTSITQKGVATLSVLLWLGVILAGRWIAYVDYLLPPE